MLLFRAFVLSLVFCHGLFGADYFVSKSGSDSNAGTTPELAFLTIQRGVDALSSGDTLTIGPGEYAESVFRESLGDSRQETVIRAAVPGTTILVGDVPAPKFEPMEGQPYIYVADWSGPFEAVNEADTLRILIPRTSVGELAYSPGSYFYETRSKKLYLSTSDFERADKHCYTLSLNPRDGLYLNKATRVVIDGLSVRGFSSRELRPATPGKFSSWGIVLFNAKDCIIRNCAVALNAGGIVIATGEGGGNLIEHCIGYGNSSPHSVEAGNIMFFGPRKDRISHCLSFRSSGNGFRLYGSRKENTAADGSVIEHCIGWGNKGNDFFVKGGGVAEYALTKNIVATNRAHALNVRNVLIGGANQYLPEERTPLDSVRLTKEMRNKNAEFADPLNHDYRLQANSVFRGKGPNQTDRGPYPYEPNIFYVKPDGDDSADGLSLGAAWKTLPRAFSQIKAGDTLYLEEGVYSGDLTLNLDGMDEAPVEIRGRGHGNVVIEGKLTISRSRSVQFRRLVFQNDVTVDQSNAVGFEDCRFFSAHYGLKAVRSSGLQVSNCEFTHFSSAAIHLDSSRQAKLVSNLFDNSRGVAISIDGGAEAGAAPILFSDYNSFSNIGTAVRDLGETVSLANWRKNHDQHSSEIRPEYVPRDGVPHLANRFAFQARGYLVRNVGLNTGIFRESEGNFVSMTLPEVTSVTATTANIEWTLTGRASCAVAWGETPECRNKGVSFNPYINEDLRACYSLRGLKPDTKYYFRVSSMSLPKHLADLGQPQAVDPKYEVISFTTAASDPAPVTYYVAPDGSDSNDGLSRPAAWKSIAYAGARARPGDTVLIAGGTYSELVRVNATGEEGKTITFQNIPGEKVIMSGDARKLNRAFILNNKSHIRIDGLYFREFGLDHWHTGVINILASADIEITRCFYDGRGKGYPSSFLNAVDCSGFVLTDSVVMSGIYGIDLRNCNRVKIENNVFVRNMIEATKLELSGSGNTVRNNIFTDSMPDKRTVSYHLWSGYRQIEEDNNCYFLRIDDGERKLFSLAGFAGAKAAHPSGVARIYRCSVEEYNRDVAPTTSFVADPKFKFLEGMGDTIRKLLESNQKDNGVRYAADLLISKSADAIDFRDLFSTNPKLMERQIGLRPENFGDFHFNVK